MLKPLKRKFGFNLQLVFLVAICAFSSAVGADQELRSERVIVVQEGETLSEIVEREMRSFVHWPAVAKHNNLQDPQVISVGQVIRIPLTYTRSKERAVVLFVKGVAERKSDDRSRDANLQRGDDVVVGDEILTGSNGFVSVEFSAGSVINVQPDSHVSVVNLACEEVDVNCVIELYAKQGGVQSRVNHRTNQPVKFTIETPSGSAAVRGTVFDLDTSSVSSSTAVTRGKVDMSAEGVTAGVDSGFGVLVKAGSAPEVPRALLAAPVVKQVPLRLAKGDVISWWDDSEAASYKVIVSEDEQARVVASSGTFDNASFIVPLALKGPHYINIRSVDKQGLKGMPTSLLVQLVSVLPSINSPLITGEVVGQDAAFTLRTRADSKALSFEIQLADNPDFRQLDTYDIAAGQTAVLPLKKGSALWSRARAVYADFSVSHYSEPVRVSR